MSLRLVSVFDFYTHPPTIHNNFLICSCDHMTSFSTNHGSKFATPALMLSHWLVLALCTYDRGVYHRGGFMPSNKIMKTVST